MDSDAYRAGAAQGRLVLQRCADCGRVRHYPRVLCDACYSFAVEPVEAGGAGTVHSWTVAHHPFDPAVADEVPYVLLTVDMAEGVRVLGRLRGAEPSTGLPVRITFEADADGAPRPVFVPG
ncbi:MAG TPA: OB-fold domain-containing protein [Pseudonocardia sp.]|jgi:hypothetical protein